MFIYVSQSKLLLVWFWLSICSLSGVPAEEVQWGAQLAWRAWSFLAAVGGSPQVNTLDTLRLIKWPEISLILSQFCFWAFGFSFIFYVSRFPAHILYFTLCWLDLFNWWLIVRTPLPLVFGFVWMPWSCNKSLTLLWPLCVWQPDAWGRRPEVKSTAGSCIHHIICSYLVQSGKVCTQNTNVISIQNSFVLMKKEPATSYILFGP